MTDIADIRRLIDRDVFDYQQLVGCLSRFRKPRDKIRRFLASGGIVRIKKGLYAFAPPYRSGPLSHGAIRIECRFDCTPDADQCRTDQCRNRAVFQPGTNAFSNGAQEATERFSTGMLIRFSVGLFRPTVDANRVLGLLQLKLEQLAGAVTGIEVAALETGPLAHHQMALFADADDLAAHDDRPAGEA